MRIYVIRHGETDLNVRGVLQGWLDAPLNDSGRLLAGITGRALRGVRFDGCFSSPLRRARETAETVLYESANPVPIVTDERLKEIFFGERDGSRMTPEEAQRFFTDPFSAGRFPGGEGVPDVCARTQAFLAELTARDDGKTYLVSTHGCAMRAMLNRLYDDPRDYWHGHVPYNCSVTVVEAEGGRARIAQDDRIFYDAKYIVDRYKLRNLSLK